jgi:acetyl esterase
MTDYAALIDAETWAFIERTNSHYPPDTVDYTVAEQRAIYDHMCRAFFVGYPEGVTAETTAIQLSDRAVPIRVYRKAGPNTAAMVLYFHGGGFMLGGLDSHDDVCAELCGRTGFEVVAVDYRLAPEFRHPAAFDDAVAAFHWAAAAYARPVVLCGDSAGGNLAAAVSHATRGRVRAPAGQVLIYPGLGGDRNLRSYREHAEAPMLTVRDLDFYATIRGGSSGDATQSPLADTDFSALPPTVAITAQCDPLSSDGEAYRDRILAAGGKAWWHEEQGLVHGYLRGRHAVGRAGASFSRIVEAVSALGRGSWPYEEGGKKS